jgi:hypothetical protein
MGQLSPEARFALDEVSRIHVEERLAKATVRREVEEQYRERLQGIRYRKSLAANRAVAGGVSKSAVGRALGTTSYNTVAAVLAVAADAVVSEPPVFEFDVAAGVGVLFRWAFPDGVVSSQSGVPFRVVEFEDVDSFGGSMQLVKRLGVEFDYGSGSDFLSVALSGNAGAAAAASEFLSREVAK